MPSAADIENRKDGKLLHVSLFYIDRTGEENYQVFTDWGDWLEHVIKKSKKHKNLRIIWAHNGSNYDWQHLCQFILKNRPDIQFQVKMTGSSGIAVILSVPTLRYKIRLNDSYRLLPYSLLKLSQELNVTHKKIELDNTLPEILYNTDPVKYFDYLKNDTVGLSEVLLSFWQLINEFICQDNPIRKLKGTIASQAMQIFRNCFLEHSIQTVWNEEIKELERKAYHGGLVLCPNHGIFSDCSMYDVNSMYPTAMTIQPVPTSGTTVWTRAYKPGRLAIYHVKYRLPDKRFVYIYNDAGQLSASGEGWITSIEYDYILAHGGTAKITSGFYYLHSGLLLKDYAIELYRMKSQAKEQGLTALTLISKLLLNSLYGKFAQRETFESMKLMSGEQIKDAIHKRQKIKVLGDMTIVEETRKSDYTAVAIAAFITARARLLLMDAIHDNYSQVIYADTDSLIITGQQIVLNIGRNLGQWSTEFNGCDVILLGRKNYSVIKGSKVIKIRSKGVSLSQLSRQMTNQDIINVMRRLATEQIESYEFYFFRPPTNREVLIKGFTSGHWLERHRNIKPTDDASKDRAQRFQSHNFHFDISGEITLTQAIIQAGGIAPYNNGYWKEEYSRIPFYLKRKTGLKLDQIAEYLRDYYPQFNIETENQLLEKIY